MGRNTWCGRPVTLAAGYSGAGRDGGFVPDPRTPLPRLGSGVHHQLRVVPPITQASSVFQDEDVEPNHASTASSDSSDSDCSGQAGSDVSSFNSGAMSDTTTSHGEALGDASSPKCGAQTTTAVRTVARQLGAHHVRTGRW